MSLVLIGQTRFSKNLRMHWSSCHAGKSPTSVRWISPSPSPPPCLPISWGSSRPHLCTVEHLTTFPEAKVLLSPACPPGPPSRPCWRCSICNTFYCILAISTISKPTPWQLCEGEQNPLVTGGPSWSQWITWALHQQAGSSNRSWKEQEWDWALIFSNLH